MKNIKNLTLRQKKFLESKGLDPNIHGIVKNHPEFFEFYNKVTGVTLKLSRWLNGQQKNDINWNNKFS